MGMVAAWSPLFRDEATPVTGWIVLIVLPIVLLFAYLYLVWWISQVMKRAAREQTRSLRDDEL